MSYSTSSQDLWELFVAEAAAVVDRCLELLAPDPPQPRDWSTAAGMLETLEAQAALMGVPEVNALARASKAVCLDAPTDSGPTRAALLRLRDAFDELRAPDASGAHLDPAPLIEALELLRSGGPPTHGPPPPPPPPAAAEEPDGWLVDEDMVEPFIEECTERIESLSTGLVQLESTQDPELVRSIFRDLHTLKGSSGFVGLKRMNRLAHAAEDLVGEVRDGKRPPDRQVIDALLAALDGLKAILDQAVSRAPINMTIEPLLDRLRAPDLPAPANGRSFDLIAPASSGAAPRVADRPSGGLSLRVDFDKLDLLLNLVGELVLGKADIHEVGGQLRHVTDDLEAQRRRQIPHQPDGGNGKSGALDRALNQLEGVGHGLEQATRRLDMVSAELRDQVMTLRMVPIAGLFNKYRRVVRDLSHSLGKEVDLTIQGAETELDKLLVEQLDDPLLHLVRNAVDHGIEAPEKRREHGKPERGRLLISASHRGHQIVIEVVDDGAGIEADQVGAKALGAGLITEEDLGRMDRHQLLELIFLPGLSTAKEVTGTSGRGVGMDVVRQAIVGLKGGIEIDSTPGEGTRFTLNLPLTLAISNVLLCRAGGQVLAVPIHAVKHTLMADPERTRDVATHPTLRLDQEVALIDVAATLGLPATTSSPPFPVALVESLGGTFGLVFDRLLGRQEIVIKSLGSLLQRVPCCAGATLIGERCALILDVPALVRRALESPTSQPIESSDPRAEMQPPMILVAEDSDTVREDLRRLLIAGGYRVQEARDGNEALMLATQHSFDLISTDVMMPGMDGYELCRRLRQIPTYASVPIIMLTGRDQEIDRIQGFDAGVDAYMVKPVDHAEMTGVVRRLLEARSHQDDGGGET